MSFVIIMSNFEFNLLIYLYCFYKIMQYFHHSWVKMQTNRFFCNYYQTKYCHIICPLIIDCFLLSFMILKNATICILHHEYTRIFNQFSCLCYIEVNYIIIMVSSIVILSFEKSYFFVVCEFSNEIRSSFFGWLNKHFKIFYYYFESLNTKKYNIIKFINIYKIYHFVCLASF